MRRRYALLSVALLYLGSACMQDPEAPHNQPDTPTLSVDEASVTRVSMLVNGSFGHDLTDITSYGVELSEALFDAGGEVRALVPQEVGADGYALGISDLQPNSTYYLRAFVSNGHSKMYSSVITQKTPETSVASVSDVTLSADGTYMTATLEDNGGRSVEEVGFVWGEQNDRRALRREKRYPATLSDDGKSFKLPVSYIGKGTHYVLAYAEDNKEATGFSRIALERIVRDDEPLPEFQPANEIWYTSTDGEVVPVNQETIAEFGVNLVSNVYADGKGIIAFDGPLTVIATSAFRNCPTLETVSLAGTQITDIYWGGFMNCSSLKSISLPASLKILGGCALEGTAISSIELPSSLESIDHDAFASCPRLEEITIPESVTYISPIRAFGEKTLIKAFYGKGATADHACLIMDDSLVGIANKDQELDFVIPDGVKTLGSYLFDFWCNFKSITFPSSLEVGSESMRSFSSPQRLSAFYGSFVSEDNRCLIINNEMLGFAFYNLGASSYTVPAGVKVMGEACMYNQNNNELKTLILPEGVESVKQSFIGLTSIESVELPSSLKEIDDKAFFAAYDLKRLTVPASVESIGSLAFQAAGYEATRQSARPSSLQIEPRADDANGMTDITFLSATPPAIQPDTFDQMVYDCPLYVPADAVDTYKSATNWSKYADRIQAIPSDTQPFNEIWYTSTDGNIVVPNRTDGFDVNIVSNTYTDGKGVITFDGDLTVIYDSAFWGCSALTSIQLPNSLRIVRGQAFGCCNLLETFHVPESVESFSNYRVFTLCSNLSSFTGKYSTDDHRALIVNDVMAGFASFGLTEYTVENGVRVIGTVFESCEQLEKINLPSGLEKINSEAFSGCSALQDIELPSTLKTIGPDAFTGCKSLTTIDIPSNVTSLNHRAFLECPNLTSFTGKFASGNGRFLVSLDSLLAIAPKDLEELIIPNGITNTCPITFPGKKLVFPETVTTICQVTHCTNLEEFTINATVPPSIIKYFWISDGSPSEFLYNKDCPIYVPSQSVDAYKTAEGWRNYADRIQPIPGDISPNKYLTFTSEGTTKLSLSNQGYAPVLYYSFDTTSWTQWDYGELSFAANKPLYICGDNANGLCPDSNVYTVNVFTASGDLFAVSGDIMSLLNKDEDMTAIPGNPGSSAITSCFYGLFRDCTILTSGPSLPASQLTPLCYSYMFSGCTALKVAPELPATIISTRCYDHMFEGCSALTEAPALSANSLATGCYANMFQDCTGLSSAPELPATTLTGYCYDNMFQGCTRLTAAPVLPATAIDMYSYRGMFSGCTSLVTPPELPATSFKSFECYEEMFKGCTSLATAPALPVTELTNGCYANMFKDCTSLRIAPELPAEVLARNCYYGMFENCSKLNYVKCLVKEVNDSANLNRWLYGVASSGTFVKSAQASNWPAGSSGIPEGWAVVNDGDTPSGGNEGTGEEDWN